MRLNAIQTLIILLAITVGTVITRFLPPILFPHGKPLPKFLQELCTLLPPAMMGLLLVYSLRNVSFASAGQWLPECIAIAVTAGLHLWRRNSLLSIAGLYAAGAGGICLTGRDMLSQGRTVAARPCFYHIAARMWKRCTSPSAMTIPGWRRSQTGGHHLRRRGPEADDGPCAVQNAPFMLRDEPAGGAGSGVGVRGVPPLQSHLRRTHLCLNQSPAGLLPHLRRDPGVRCIVQRGSHRQLLAEEAVCPAVARSGAA